MFRDFLTALQFLTIFPVSRKHEVRESEFSRSLTYFPFVGFLIGLMLVWADRAMLWFFPDALSNVILLLISVVITRALHVDGLADSVDGMMGGTDAESRLAIMRDSRVGTAGVLAVFFVLLIKYACLNSLFGDYKAAVLLTAPAFGRWSQMIMMFRSEYGREQGTGRAFVGHVRLGGLFVASLVALGISAWVIVQDDQTATLAVGIPFCVAVATLLWRWYVVRRLGGVTGDTVGAISEMNEALTFLLFVFFLAGRQQ